MMYGGWPRNIVSVLILAVTVFVMVLVADSRRWPLLVGAAGVVAVVALGRLLYVRVNRKHESPALTQEQLELVHEVAERNARFLKIQDSWGAINDVIKDSVRSGLLKLTAPDHMRQGKHARVLMGIAPGPDAEQELNRRFKNAGVGGLVNAMVEALSVDTSPVDTSPVMSVECHGDGFVVTPLSATAQVVASAAFWEFDVFAHSSGLRTLLFLINLELPVPGIPELRRSVPALDHKVDVEVSPLYSAGVFWVHNWQWVLATFIGLGGAITAWLKLLGH